MPSISFPGGDEGQALVRAYIDDTLTALFCELCLSPSEAHPSITLRRRPKATSMRINPRTGALEADQQEDADRTYSWPGSTALEAWRFSTGIRSGCLLIKNADGMMHEQLSSFESLSLLTRHCGPGSGFPRGK